MLVAAAFIVSYIESLLPPIVPVPGIKIGLANIVVLFAIYLLGPLYGVGISVVRVILSGLTFGSLFAMAYSLAGCLLSCAVMLLLKKIKGFSILGVSIAGGVAHNLGQSIVAVLLLGTAVVYYLPVLIVAGIAAGIVTGIIANVLIKHFSKL